VLSPLDPVSAEDRLSKMKGKLSRKCPLCGAKLDGDSENNGLLEKMQKMKEQGIFQETMYIAVRIVQSFTNGYGPTWFKNMLEEQNTKMEKSIHKGLLSDIRPYFREIMDHLGNPQGLGPVQERAIAKRLSALKMGEDEFTTERSRIAGEDVLCLIKEQGQVIGKIVIESKKTHHWRQKFIEQTLGHMKRENTEFGILATTKMPDDALNYADWRTDALVVKLDYLEFAYLLMRKFLKLKRELEGEYSSKLNKMEFEERVLQELRESVTNGELDSIMGTINELTTHIDSTVSTIKAQITNKLGLLQKRTNTDTDSIRDLINKLASSHIEKIRIQLMEPTHACTNALRIKK